MRIRVSALALVIAITGTMGCATVPKGRPTGLRDAKSPAYALKDIQNEMIVSVSPVRQSVQIVSTYAAILGAGIDAIVNAKYRDAIRNALKDYDAGAVFEERLNARLAKAVPQGLSSASPLNTAAGFQNDQEAQKARFQGAATSGRDALLDLKMTYGLFGYEGILIAKLDGRLVTVPDGHKLWDNAIVVSAESILASDTLADPTKQLGANLSSPRFTVEENAISKWTGDGGKIIRARFEAAVDGVVSALLCDLGLAEEAVGEYYLGKLAMNRKKFKRADEHFKKAIQLDPSFIEARNGCAVNLAHNKQLDDAIRMEQELTQSNPDYGPAYLNLAWWYAIEKKDAAAAKPLYEKALKLGMAREKKIEKRMKQ